MVVHTCGRCNKSWNKKSSYIRHINRKFPCKEESVISINNKEFVVPNENNINIELKKLSNLVEEISRENKEIKENNKEMVERIESLEKIIRTQKNNVYFNNHGDTIVNNNINIVAYGNEQWSFLSNDQKLRILDGGFKSIQRYVQLVHMNPNKPEYNNIYVKNWKDSTGGVMINNGKEWIRCKNEVIDDLRDRGIDFIDLTHEYLKGKDLLPDHIDKKIGRFAEELDSEKGDALRKKISSDIKLDLYNYGKNKK
jgi:hypothetical protein